MAASLLKAHNFAPVTSATPTLRQKPRSSGVSVFATSTLPKAEKQAKRQPREENVGLDSKKAFYVDHTCIGQCLCTTDWSPSVLTFCDVIQHTHPWLMERRDKECGAMDTHTSATLVQTATHAGGLRQSSLAARMSSRQ